MKKGIGMIALGAMFGCSEPEKEVYHFASAEHKHDELVEAIRLNAAHLQDLEAKFDTQAEIINGVIREKRELCKDVSFWAGRASVDRMNEGLQEAYQIRVRACEWLDKNGL